MVDKSTPAYSGQWPPPAEPAPASTAATTAAAPPAATAAPAPLNIAQVGQLAADEKQFTASEDAKVAAWRAENAPVVHPDRAPVPATTAAPTPAPAPLPAPAPAAKVPAVVPTKPAYVPLTRPAVAALRSNIVGPTAPALTPAPSSVSRYTRGPPPKIIPAVAAKPLVMSTKPAPAAATRFTKEV
jgi:hypothetical protein